MVKMEGRQNLHAASLILPFSLIKATLSFIRIGVTRFLCSASTMVGLKLKGDESAPLVLDSRITSLLTEAGSNYVSTKAHTEKKRG